MTDTTSSYVGPVRDAIAAELAEHPLTDADLDNARDIARLRAELDDALCDALAALIRANRAVDELTSNHVFDVEYADTTAGEDVRVAVLDSARQLRGAHALVERVGR